jgi:hypothetical protein
MLAKEAEEDDEDEELTHWNGYTSLHLPLQSHNQSPCNYPSTLIKPDTKNASSSLTVPFLHQCLSSVGGANGV